MNKFNEAYNKILKGLSNSDNTINEGIMGHILPGYVPGVDYPPEKLAKFLKDYTKDRSTWYDKKDKALNLVYNQNFETLTDFTFYMGVLKTGNSELIKAFIDRFLSEAKLDDGGIYKCSSAMKRILPYISSSHDINEMTKSAVARTLYRSKLYKEISSVNEFCKDILNLNEK